MNTTKEEMQSKLNILSNDNFILQDRINVLNETIEIMNNRLLLKDEHREHLNKTIIEEVKRYDNAIQPLEAKNEQLIKRINILKHAIEIDKITIKTQEKTIKLYLDNLNSNTYV